MTQQKVASLLEIETPRPFNHMKARDALLRRDDSKRSLAAFAGNSQMIDSLPNDAALRVLFVDDDDRTLKAFKFSLQRTFDIVTSNDPSEALDLVKNEPNIAVVVSDFKMPRMDGATFLAQVRDISAHTVRILLTGQANTDVAARGVNQGQIFRFLTKPCTRTALSDALKDGLQQFSRVVTEQEVLQSTLHNTVRVLSEALGLANPEAFARAERIRNLALRLAQTLGMKSILDLELATMLSHLGCIGLPRTIFDKINRGIPLASDEEALHAEHPYIGALLIERIPRLEPVASIIAAQLAPYSPDMNKETAVLNMVIRFDTLHISGIPISHIIQELLRDETPYPSDMLEALKHTAYNLQKFVRTAVKIRQLKQAMILDSHIETNDGLLLLAKGAELTESTILRLIEISKHKEIIEPIHIFAPQA
jgi:CheY-like chemotaxis protein